MPGSGCWKIVMRLPDSGGTLDFGPLFRLSANEIERLLLHALPQAPVFSVYFRYNAARSLMLPRSQPRKRIPLYFFERNVLATRYLQPSPSALRQMLAEFNTLISEGEIIALSGRANDIGRRFVAYRLRGDGNLFSDGEVMATATSRLSTYAATVVTFLKENGASYARDMEWGTGFTRLQLQGALQQLAESGLASCENHEAFIQIIQSY